MASSAPAASPSPVAHPAAAAHPKPKGLDLYSRYALAGAVCCSITHGAMTPVDVVKTSIQMKPEIYNRGMRGTFRQLYREGGAGALWTGFGSTVVGYFFQGAIKFGGYEFFKGQLIGLVGQETASNWRTAIYLASSGCAEFFADVALCPLEATRIRLVSQPDFASSLFSCFARLVREEGVLRGLYSGFGPMCFKQIPYTMTKFVVYERVSETVFANIKTPKAELPNSTITAINLGSGLVAGIAAAIISQPADTLLSKINEQKGAQGSISSRLFGLAKELGFKGLFRALGARIVMVGALTAGQFAIYGDIKRVLNATGGFEIAKVNAVSPRG